MDNRIGKFLTKGLWLVLILFVFRCFVSKFETVYDFIGASGEVISITLIVMSAYSGFLWRYNPFERVPKLMGKYNGNIEYCFSGITGQKETNVEIKQTLLTVRVRITTDEIASNTVAGNLVEEHGEYVLYYTYITMPKGKFSDKNPMQYGTCRLRLEGKDRLVGTYWTSRKTVGDIELNRID